MHTRTIGLVVALIGLVPASSQGQGRRLLTVDDIFQIKSVRDPQISPDGAWVAYTVSALNAEKDNSDTDVWMTSLTDPSASPLRLTSSDKPETSPRWSPDGRYLAFLSGREGEKTQVWLLDRRGGEARKLTDYKSSVSSLAWSPDSSRLALVVPDDDPDEVSAADKDSKKAPKPIVITRLQFKRDGDGYLRDVREHVHVFDVERKTGIQLTSGSFDDSQPAWAPNGKQLAFVSNRTDNPDANENTDIFLIDAVEGAIAKQLTTSPRAESDPVFTPDGQRVLYTVGGDPADIWYDTSELGVASLSGGERILTDRLDRNVGPPRLSPDGAIVWFLIEDGGNQHLAKLNLNGGPIERVVTGEREIENVVVGKSSQLVVLESQPQYPAEVSVVTNGALTRLTHVNDELLATIELASVERFKARSADGTMIDGFLTRPPQSPNAKRLPTILRIHGGPVSQYTTGFELEWQLLAAQGFAVVAANPRGSSGYGRDFSRAIFADWGNKDFDDVMAAVDHVIAQGVADPERLGVGGWSYGGILTNYVITKTKRFKAAISGASEVNYLSNYGTDHYQRQWEGELGLPWRATDLWVKLSPFFAVEKITTPTLIMCGEADMNVPLLNSEQLYQALRRLGRETMLVIYPEQSHSIRHPSYQKDRYERYIDWYAKYLKADGTE